MKRLFLDLIFSCCLAVPAVAEVGANSFSLANSSSRFSQLESEIANPDLSGKRRVKIINELALALANNGSEDRAVALMEEAITIVESGIAIDQNLAAQTYNNLSVVASVADNYDLAAQALNSAIELYQREGNFELELVTSSNLLPVYARLGLYNLLPELRTKISSGLAGVSSQYRDRITVSLAESYVLSNSFQEALALLENLEITPQVLTLQGDIYAALEDFSQAESSYTLALNQAEKLSSEFGDRKFLARAIMLKLLAIVDLEEADSLVADFLELGDRGTAKVAQDLALLELAQQRGFDFSQFDLSLVDAAYPPYLQAKALYLSSFSNESTADLEQALKLNPDPYYRYKILARLGDLLADDSAIPYYQKAIAQIQQIKGDLVSSPSFQAEFVREVEPIHQKLVSLLVAQPSQSNLQAAISTIESLQLIELENYFRVACLEPTSNAQDLAFAKTSVVYPIFLDDQLLTIISLPSGELLHRTIALSKQEGLNAASQFRLSLNPNVPIAQRQFFSNKLYSWLVAPWLSTWENAEVDNLVFVPNDFLRNIPVAAIQDQNGKYLIQSFSVAYAPGMNLISPNSEYQKSGVVVAGLSDPHQGFEAIPAVLDELDTISETAPATVLINQEFTEVAIQNQVVANRGNVLHLATHGQFGSNPDETFLLAWNSKINTEDLNRLIQSRAENPHNDPLELLVLSACETAKGDADATLGLAGVAVRSGAKSTLASLWQVNDRSTSVLMQSFYRRFTEDSELSKAQIMQQVQQEMLASEDFSDPYYWASFMLIGNWL